MAPEATDTDPPRHCVFDLLAVARALPETSDTMLVETRLTDEAEASCRLFRVYRTVKPHYHETCDEYLQIVTGRARVLLGNLEPFDTGPGTLLFFKKRTVHAIWIVEEPLVFFAIDTPRRHPRDVVFVDPADGTPDTFIRAVRPGSGDPDLRSA